MNIETQVLEFAGTRRQETAQSALGKMKGGFCLKSALTSAETGFIFESYEQALTVRVTSAGLHGGRHFSIYDLIGHSVNGMNYVVTDLSKFNQYMSLKLENDFMKKNPEAGSRIRASFTSFMHENNLHWSRCCGNNATRQERAIHEKLRMLSSRTGKSHREILTELLEGALNQAPN
jgi:hypothetical protein